MRWLRRVAGFRPAVYVVAAGRFVNVFGRGVVYPFASLYFHLAVGIPLSLVGAGLLAFRVASAAGTLAGGATADRYGRKPVMVASMALSAYAWVGTAAAFVAVSTAAGLTLGLRAPASQALIADLTDDADRERAYGLLKVASNAGFGSGFVAGGLLYGVARTSVFLVDGATCAVAALYSSSRSRGGSAARPRGASARRCRGGPAPWETPCWPGSRC